MNKKVSKRFAVRVILVLVSLSAAVTAIGFSASGYSGTLPPVTPVDLNDPTATAEVMGFDPFSDVSGETLSDSVSGDSQNAAQASSAVTSDGIAQIPADAPVGSDPELLAMAQEVERPGQTEYEDLTIASSDNSDGLNGDAGASDGAGSGGSNGWYNPWGLSKTAVIVGGGLVVGGGVAVGIALDDDSSSSSRSSSTP